MSEIDHLENNGAWLREVFESNDYPYANIPNQLLQNKNMLSLAEIRLAESLFIIYTNP